LACPARDTQTENDWDCAAQAAGLLRLQAKLLTSLLVEKLLLEAEVFSPWGYILAEQQPLG
jgi:hypothetical protein